MFRFLFPAVLTPLLLAVPASAETAVVGHAYDKVVDVKVLPGQFTITGLVAGDGAPTTLTYPIRAGDPVKRCSRFVTLAMSQPAKYQFATIAVSSKPEFDCKLTPRAS